MVPVTPLGTGVTTGDAPVCKPFGPTGAPGTVPSEEVMPREGISVPTWANAGLPHNKGQADATINNGLMKDLPDNGRRIMQRVTAEGLCSERPQAPQSVRQRGQ